MPLAKRRERWQAMMEILQRNDAKAWRESFLHSLARGD
jgi:trehalose 6-phosphate synthase